MSNEKAIILFDGVCNFCNSSVQFIIKRDRAGYFQFASLQSEVGKSLLAQRPELQNLDSIVLIENGQFFTESSAALRIARKLDGFWKLAFLLNALPKVCRDPFYRFFAKNRYRWFGKQEACMMPTKDMRARFLSE
ncbi:thiol-disulfide oxidoreductase DCC family protein [Bacillus dakarensis]|uniref:thiol-disulfide oxidoreductase DCC family protein n=1 Tax=Robertmurraya dakarensis TaxID=1926278 RepID=UPI000981691E|nr:thiol-disulfide oxidoreductase DCC family protein [Bacillus dakarensis]